MALQYDGRQSPLIRPVTSADEVEAITRTTVIDAVEHANTTLEGIALEIQELEERATRVTAHRDHLISWLAYRAEDGQ